MGHAEARASSKHPKAMGGEDSSGQPRDFVQSAANRMYDHDYIEAARHDKWFGRALFDYSLRALIDAGLQPPLSSYERRSRDQPIIDDEPFVKFTASKHYNYIQRVSTSRRAVLLVLVGSFAPMHGSHIKVMEAADAAIREVGKQPIAGVFSLRAEDRVKAKIRPLHPDAPISTE